jgi:hypothetical protein
MGADVIALEATIDEDLTDRHVNARAAARRWGIGRSVAK